jgi:hypothetical protein
LYNNNYFNLYSVNFNINPINREFNDVINIPDDLLILPNLKGTGCVRDLLESAALNQFLLNILVQYSDSTTNREQTALLDELLQLWVETSNIISHIEIRALGLYNIDYMNLSTNESLNLLNKVYILDNFLG